MYDIPNKLVTGCKATKEEHVHYKLSSHALRKSDEEVHIYLGLFEAPNGLPGFCTTTIYVRRKNIVTGFGAEIEHVKAK